MALMNAFLLLVGLAVAATMPAGADEHALKPHMVGAKKAADLNCPAQVPGGALWEKQAVRCAFWDSFDPLPVAHTSPNPLRYHTTC